MSLRYILGSDKGRLEFMLSLWFYSIRTFVGLDHSVPECVCIGKDEFQEKLWLLQCQGNNVKSQGLWF